MTGQPPLPSFDIVPPHLAVAAMRDNGYKTTAHAVAELIDNSVQANANSVQLICVEAQGLVEQRYRHRINQIAILDDGSGMDRNTLRMALQFGNGTHLADRSGIGRFGMGLPTASLSQCCRVDVWTWTSGPDNALHAWLDLDEIRSRQMREVPEPEHEPVPTRWRDISAEPIGQSGTLVVWSTLDRVSWRGARATLENTEFLIGRMYRKMIHESGLVIRLVAASEVAGALWTMNARPNDPTYLMAPTSTPAPFHERPMFQKWGEEDQRFGIEFGGTTHDVVVRFSWATDDARLPGDGTDPGSKDYGKHARKNVGVSVVRAGRELTLDESWTNHDLRERWWGAEIEFPPALDEVFGVTNNKQAATHFSEIATFFMDDARNSDWQQVRSAWQEEGDPRVHLLDIANWLDNNLNIIRKQLRQQTMGRRGSRQRHDDVGVEDRATARIKERIEAGDRADKVDDAVDDETHRQEVQKDLIKFGVSERTAREIADAVVLRDRRVIFVDSEQDTDAFFFPKALPGVAEVVFNTAHPTYQQLVAMLDPEVLSDDVQALRGTIRSASDTLKLLICAWARYELEEREGERRQRVADARKEWGKMAKLFLADVGDDGSA